MSEAIRDAVLTRLGKVVVNPMNEMIDDVLGEVVTSVGSFALRAIRGRFYRSITFSVGSGWGDRWMEDALYSILYQYNDIRKGSKLTLQNGAQNFKDEVYFRLSAGVHNLKYRDYNIILVIEVKEKPVASAIRSMEWRTYTIMTYDLSPEFILSFEKDMKIHRNQMLQIKSSSPTVTVFRDFHEPDGVTYWNREMSIPKRPLSTVYLPTETKKTVIRTINNFFGSREYYRKHGISWNLKILLYSHAGLGKDSLAKAIASEYNRNIYNITGGKNGRFIPNAITDHCEEIHAPLFLISDIDKYPYLINDTDIELNQDNKYLDDRINYKQLFGHMINALDGVMSGDGKIIVMTTNHIEKFSEVFFRPGRVDLKLELKYVTPDVFRRFFFDHYEQSLPEKIVLKNKNLSIATLQFDVVIAKLSAEEFISKHCK